MVTTLNNQTSAREIGYEVAQYVAGRAVVVAGTPNKACKIGTIPAGSLILSLASRVVTAVAGGVPAAGIGTTSGGNELSGALAITAGSQTLPPTGVTGGPLTADTDIWLNVTGGATSGDVIGLVMFAKPIA